LIFVCELKMKNKKQTYKLSRIFNAEDSRMKEVMNLYTNSFPENERQLDETIFHRLTSAINEIYVLENSMKEIIGMAMIFPIKETDFTLLDYFAIQENKRDLGYGSMLFQQIKQLVFQQNRKMVLEVEKPLDNNSSNEQIRRIEFYKKNGAILLKNVPYALPSIDGKSPVEMLLLICVEQSELVNRQKIADLIYKLYQQVYQKESNDELLTSLLKNLPKTVTFNF
jgi:hypothetical protein